MKYLRSVFSFVVFFVLCNLTASAATIYWRPTVANGGSRYEWTNLNNWSTTSSLPYTAPAALPGNTDKANIDYSVAHSIEVNTTVSVQDLTIINTSSSDATVLTLYAASGITLTVLRNLVIGSNNTGNHYGLEDGRNLLLVFAPQNDVSEFSSVSDLEVVFNDQELGIGTTHFRFDKSDLENIPEGIY